MEKNHAMEDTIKRQTRQKIQARCGNDKYVIFILLFIFAFCFFFVVKDCLCLCFVRYQYVYTLHLPTNCTYKYDYSVNIHYNTIELHMERSAPALRFVIE